jgi:ATP-dependent DNA helicase RecG
MYITTMDLQTPLTQAGRIYKVYAPRLEKLGIFTFQDFLFHLPSRYDDYSVVSQISQIQPGETVTVRGNVIDIKNQYLSRGRIKTIQKAIVADETGTIQLTWFNQPYLIKAIRQNAIIAASGRVERFGRNLSMQSPEYELLTDTNESLHTGRLIPVYPETKGVSSKWLRRQVFAILQELHGQLPDYLPEEIKLKHHFMELEEAIREIHFPKNLETAEQARQRLAYDEMFLMQLAAHMRRSEWQQQKQGTAIEIAKYQPEIKKLIDSLPFALTHAQQQAVDDILHDISQIRPMNRLLQGDVGSGKTVVATVAMYATYLNGLQSAFMAPTEILAQQHFKTISFLLAPFNVKVGLVTGNKKSTEIKNQKSGIRDKKKSSTEFDVLVGTHALLHEKVQFRNLAFVAIDEQQRFGVQQRGTIRQKGNNPHLLTMTATPIPRTVALTMYGDLDLSYLNEMPVGRKRVKTWLVPPEKRNGAYDWIRKQIKETDSQAFIICPFIEESENMQTIKAASKEFERLKKEVYPDLKLGLLHGKQKAKEKDQILNDFREKKFDILVATPVVEVGIDIPNATIIMIEASERFGLSQLHQLRGRVGRGAKQSYCLLFTESKNEQTLQRLKSMETVYAGSELAELDLKLRGAGNLYGTAQHGMAKLKVASFSDTRLIRQARNDSHQIFLHLSHYPQLAERLSHYSHQTISPD